MRGYVVHQPNEKNNFVKPKYRYVFHCEFHSRPIQLLIKRQDLVLYNWICEVSE